MRLRKVVAFVKTIFGTDGIRGRVPEEIGAEQAFRVGVAVAEQFGRSNMGRRLIVVGHDPRRSSDMLEAAVTAGICAAGVDVERLGVIPTPAVALLTRAHGADAGMMISASHNAAEYNGIKCFDSCGYKFTEQQEADIEAQMGRERLPVDRVGWARALSRNPIQEYTDYLTGCVRGELSGIRVLFDCANGAASTTITRLIRCLDLHADVICCRPDGDNINDHCGSTNTEQLRRIMQGGQYDVGFAFDGDADRCVAVDEHGEELDGDYLIGLFAQQQKAENPERDGLITTTIMSNAGMKEFLNKQGIAVAYTDVGDRQVMQAMRENDSWIGGEPSGHLIFREYGTTGDGQLTAIRLMDWMAACGTSVSAMREQWTPQPQILRAVPVARGRGAEIVKSDAVAHAVKTWEAKMKRGRLLIRPSGTEAVVRVMAECRDSHMAEQAAEEIVRIIAQSEEQNRHKMTNCTKAKNACQE